jgi:hypothetical protein
LNRILPGAIIAAIGGAAVSTAALATPAVTWVPSNAVVDNVLYTTTLYTDIPPTTVTNGRLVWDPAEALSPGIGTDDTAPNSPPGATGCILTAGALCDDPRQSGKRYKLEATAPGPIDMVFRIDNNGLPFDGLYRVFGKIINAMPVGMTGYTLELGTGVGSKFQQFTGAEGITFYQPLNNPPKESELASIFPAGLFSQAGTPPGSGEGFFSGDRSGFNAVYSPTMLQFDGIFGDYASLFGNALMPVTSVPDGYFFDDDNDPLTEDVLQAYFDPNASAWLFGQENGFAAVDAATLAAWGADPAYYIGEIEDLANTNLQTSIVFNQVTSAEFTIRTTPSAVPVPAGIALLGSVIAGAGAFTAIRRRIGSKA